MSQSGSVHSVYTMVIDEVCQGVRADFEEMGVDESILQELRRSWQSKVVQARQAGYADPEGKQPTPTPENNVPESNGQSAFGDPKASSSSSSSSGDPNEHAQATPVSGKDALGHGYYTYGGDFMRTKPGGTIYGAHGQPIPGTNSTPEHGKAKVSEGPREVTGTGRAEEGGEGDGGGGEGGGGSATEAPPFPSTSARYLPPGVSAASLASIAAANLSRAAGSGSQQDSSSPGPDGSTSRKGIDSVTAQADAALEAAHLHQKRTLEQTEDAEAERIQREEERKRAKRARQMESGGRFDDPDDVIGSDLDDTDDEDDRDEEADEDTNIILCTYEKVTRTKNKWKCVLKDGIMTVDGRDYVFHKANGDFEW